MKQLAVVRGVPHCQHHLAEDAHHAIVGFWGQPEEEEGDEGAEGAEGAETSGEAAAEGTTAAEA